MRLIRVYNSSSEGQFTQNFYRDLVLKKNSKIGLLNASFAFSEDNIDVNENNNTFRFRLITTDPFRKVELEIGSYNVDSFLEMFNESINKALKYEQKGVNNKTLSRDVGFMWKTILNIENRIKIQFNRLGAIVPSFKLVNVVKNLETFSRTNTGADNNTAFGYDTQPFTKGCGYYRMRLPSGGKENNKLTFGFLSELPEDSETELKPEQYEYAVSIDIIGSNYTYTYWVDGNETSTLFSPNPNDYVYIILSEGKIIFGSYESSTPPSATNQDLVILGQTDYNNKDLYPAFTLFNKDAEIQYVNYTPNPYTKKTSDGVSIFEEIDEENNKHDTVIYTDNDNLGAPDTPNVSASVVRIEFEQGVKQLLGFANDIYQKNLIKGYFKSNESFRITSIPSSIIIELPQFNLDCIDSKINDKRSIVAVIPNFIKESKNTLVYNAPTPIMIDLDNPHEISLRSLRVILSRLTTDDPIKLVEGYGCTLTFVVE